MFRLRGDPDTISSFKVNMRYHVQQPNHTGNTLNCHYKHRREDLHRHPCSFFFEGDPAGPGARERCPEAAAREHAALARGDSAEER